MVAPTVFYITVDPNNPSVLYAGTTGEGGFKSVDGAATWTPLGIDTTVWQIIVDPTDSNVVYAGSNGNGVYKSTDAGATFARVGSPRVGVVLSLASAAAVSTRARPPRAYRSARTAARRGGTRASRTGSRWA